MEDHPQVHLHLGTPLISTYQDDGLELRWMKILIVDDNAAVQEIIKDILMDEGHNVRLASTVDEAVEKIKTFGPDVVMLDSSVGEEDGTRVISRVREESPDTVLHVILLKSPNELSPKDDPSIRGFVDKPFKSSDILDALKDIKYEESESEQHEGSKKHRFRSRRKKSKEPVQTGPVNRGLTYGMSYVTFETEPSEVYDLIDTFDPSKYSLLVVTANKAKAIKERFSYINMDVIQLTGSGKSGTMSIHGLGTLMAAINDFIRKNPMPVVAFDTFGDIIEANGVNRSLLMVHQLMAERADVCTFVLSVDEGILTDKDRSILLHDMIRYTKESD